MRRLAFLLSVAFAATACELAPVYQRPEVAAIPAAFKENQGWVAANPADELPKGAWWELFHDPELNRLEDAVTQANQDIKAAMARLDEARATVLASTAGYYPTVTLNASQTANRYSVNKPYFLTGANPQFKDYISGFSASYEPDVWGRVRDTVASSKALKAASAADLATIDLSSHAELASDYFNLKGYDAAQKILDGIVEADRKTLELTEKLFNGGIDNSSDVDAAQQQLQDALTAAAENHLKRSQMEHAIAVLTGQPAGSFSIAPATEFNEAAPEFDAGLPSTLLERRPDIAAAERRVAAANANIGVARTAFYPSFGLNASVGLEGSTLDNWSHASSLFWSMGPSAALILMDGGLRQSMTDQARAAYDEAAASYRQTVLSAFQEVEDNLAALRELDRENKSASAASRAAGDAYTLADIRFKGGIASYLDVTQAQNEALQSELAATTLRVRRSVAAVMLVKALGGGWNAQAQEQ